MIPSPPLDPLPGPGRLECLANARAQGALKFVLTADNAVSLAGIVRTVEPRAERERIHNLGILLAPVLGVGMLLAAGWILQFSALPILVGPDVLLLAQRHVLEMGNTEPVAAPAPGRQSIVGVLLPLAATDQALVAVGLGMVGQGTLPSLAPSEPVLLLTIASLFLWDCSQQAPMES